MSAQAYCGRLGFWDPVRIRLVHGEIAVRLASLCWVAGWSACAVPHLWWVDTFTDVAASLLTSTMGFRVGGLTLHFLFLFLVASKRLW